ncbi:unnamed protein product [Hermetia illucens]|uniref:Uncharacterized protein n=1 Tax=Hermetia illucens TaxID=343691 RepID=A0A7R8UA76_HERIL|nr:unnamed protein product [Hermetia illucens]
MLPPPAGYKQSRGIECSTSKVGCGGFLGRGALDFLNFTILVAPLFPWPIRGESLFFHRLNVCCLENQKEDLTNLHQKTKGISFPEENLDTFNDEVEIEVLCFGGDKSMVLK